MTISLREENEELREENRTIRAALNGMQAQRWRGLRLSNSRRFLLGLFATGRLYSVESLLDLLQAQFPRDDDRSNDTVKVLVCYLRRILAKCDPPISIRNLVGQGYIMDPEDCARLLARKE